MKKASIKTISIIVCVFCVFLCCFVFVGCEQEKNLPITEDFIQPYLCRYWTVLDWENHIDKLQQKNYTTLILQITAEIDCSEYVETCFPCQETTVSQSNTLDNMLTACKNKGFFARIGLCAFSDWWESPTNEKINNYIYITNKTIDYISPYLDKYSSVVKGLYFTPELYTQRFGYEILWAKFLSETIDKINSINPNISLMLSPYYSSHYGLTYSECFAMWKNFFLNANLRQIDIIAPQDGSGLGEREANLIDDKLIIKNLRSCLLSCQQYSKCKFYVNIEFFTKTKGVYASDEKIAHQRILASKFGEALISFSYSHYYCSY
ncbi:MAG: DUF4434 domain-containing protein [Clostridia bacterium]